MTNTKMITSDSDIAARPKYYVPYGVEIANGNRAWVLAALMSAVALVSLVMLFFVRMHPPTVIRIGPDGEAEVLGQPGREEYGTRGSEISRSLFWNARQVRRNDDSE